jgi:hypothetical protein
MVCVPARLKVTLCPGYAASNAFLIAEDVPVSDAAVYTIRFPSDSVYSGVGVLVIVVATGVETSVVTTGTDGTVVTTVVVVCGAVVVPDVHPATSARTSKRLHTIPRIIIECGGVVSLLIIHRSLEQPM